MRLHSRGTFHQLTTTTNIRITSCHRTRVRCHCDDNPTTNIEAKAGATTCANDAGEAGNATSVVGTRNVHIPRDIDLLRRCDRVDADVASNPGISPSWIAPAARTTHIQRNRRKMPGAAVPMPTRPVSGWIVSEEVTCAAADVTDPKGL